MSSAAADHARKNERRLTSRRWWGVLALLLLVLVAACFWPLRVHERLYLHLRVFPELRKDEDAIWKWGGSEDTVTRKEHFGSYIRFERHQHLLFSRLTDRKEDLDLRLFALAVFSGAKRDPAVRFPLGMKRDAAVELPILDLYLSEDEPPELRLYAGSAMDRQQCIALTDWSSPRGQWRLSRLLQMAHMPRVEVRCRDGGRHLDGWSAQCLLSDLAATDGPGGRAVEKRLLELLATPNAGYSARHWALYALNRRPAPRNPAVDLATLDAYLSPDEPVAFRYWASTVLAAQECARLPDWASPRGESRRARLREMAQMAPVELEGSFPGKMPSLTGALAAAILAELARDRVPGQR